MAKMELKPWVKYALITIVIAALGIFLYNASSSSSTDNTNDKSFLSNIFSGSNNGNVVTIGVNTYGGFTPIVWGNGGLKGSEDSPFFKKYGLKLNIVIQDDFLAGREAFKSNNIDMIYCTADVLPTEMGSNSAITDARYIMMLNWSRGADALVVNKGINKVSDLKGKKVAVASGTASHTLLINILETNQMTMDDIEVIKVNSGGDAAQVFKAQQCDACVTWTPDDKDCVAAINGAKVLFSTKEAANLICDGLMTKASFIEEKPELAKKVVEAILWANSEMNSKPESVKEAAKVFAKAFQMDEEFCLNGCSNIRFATLGDNANFLGLDATYVGTKGDDMYTKMSRVYSTLQLAKNPLPWRKVSDTSIIESLMSKNEIDNDQVAEGAKKFSAPTNEDVNKAEISNKQVTIEYPVNGYTLNDAAKSTIDIEFVNIAKQFSGARIRVEGNTDNTGSKELNKTLSKQRAQSVVDYLIKEYGFDTNRFVVVGNGAEHAIKNGIIGSNQSYRTTDFQLIN